MANRLKSVVSNFEKAKRLLAESALTLNSFGGDFDNTVKELKEVIGDLEMSSIAIEKHFTSTCLSES